MDVIHVAAEVTSDGAASHSGYFEAGTERDSTQERENDGEVRDTDTPERPGKPRRKPGRPAKDPLNQTFLFQCRAAEDLESTLRDYLKEATSPPEHTTVEFHFPVSAAFMVYPPGHSQAIKDPLKRIFSKTAVSVAEALQPTLDPKEQIEKQRRISKICVEAVAKADGFKYGSNNNWISKEDQASRFSFYCLDSTLNRARAGNPAASDRVAHKAPRKPIYQCEGTIVVKFSITKQQLEVIYKHIPCHETYAARAPVPRRGTRRRILMELFEPEKLPAPRIPGRKAKEAQTEEPRNKASLDRAATQSANDAGSFAHPPPSQEERQDSLEPVLQLVNTLEAEISNDTPALPAEVPTESQDASVEASLKSKKRKSNLRDRRRIPGTSLQEERLQLPGTSLLLWDGSELGTYKECPKKSRKTTTRIDPGKGKTEQSAINIEDDNGIVAPISAEPVESLGEPSEIDVLKAKLAEAERRIHRLEADKTSTVSPPPQPYYNMQQAYHPPSFQQYQYPPQVQWSPQHGYGRPPPPPGYFHPGLPPGLSPAYAGGSTINFAPHLQGQPPNHSGSVVQNPKRRAPRLPGGLPNVAFGNAEDTAGAAPEPLPSAETTEISTQAKNILTADKPATTESVGNQ